MARKNSTRQATKPEAQAPEVQAPEVQAPEVQATEAQATEAQAPEVQAPEVQAPEVQAPEVQAPEVQAPEVQAPEPSEPSALSNMATELTKPEPSAPAAPAAPAAPIPASVVVPGLGAVVAATNVLKRAASLSNVPSQYAKIKLVAGRPCKVRGGSGGYTNAVLAMLAHVAEHGPSTGEELAAVANGDLLKYSIKNQWLVPFKG